MRLKLNCRSNRIRPSNTGRLRRHASGATGSPLPETRMSAALIGSTMPRRWASVRGTRSGWGVIGGSTAKSLTFPAFITILSSSTRLSFLMVDTKSVGARLSPRTVPLETPVPSPVANTRSRPVVMPLAAAVNWSSPISMSHEPLPIGTPANVATYRASSLPWALALPHRMTAIAAATRELRDILVCREILGRLQCTADPLDRGTYGERMDRLFGQRLCRAGHASLDAD